MKIKLAKVGFILGIILISLFSCLFLQSVFATSVSTTNPKDNTLKSKFSDKIDADTLDYLQYAAARKKDAFFDFDSEKMVGRHTPIYIYGGSYDDYYYSNPSVICVNPDDHTQANNQLVSCIMDITDDSVTVIYFEKVENGVVYVKTRTTTSTGTTITTTRYKNGALVKSESSNPNPKTTRNNTKLTEYQKKYAEELAYFACQSVDRKESLINYDFSNSYKVLMRFWSLAQQAQIFQKLGVPNTLVPTTKNSLPLGGQNFYKSIKNQYEKDKKNHTYTARFVFLQGTLGGYNGQNDCIYSGKEEPKTSLKIVKVDDTNSQKKLKGAQFNIYTYDSTKENNIGEKLNDKVLKTNSEGVVTYSKGLEVGKKYIIEEKKAPTGYQISNKYTSTDKLKTGTNQVTIKNQQKADKQIGIVKLGEVDKQPVSGAKFVFLQYRQYNKNGGVELNPKYINIYGYVGVNDTGKSKSWYRDSDNMDWKKLTLGEKPKDQTDGQNKIYPATDEWTSHWSVDFYTEILDRTKWKNEDGSNYSGNGTPYINVNSQKSKVITTTNSNGNRVKRTVYYYHPEGNIYESTPKKEMHSIDEQDMLVAGYYLDGTTKVPYYGTHVYYMECYNKNSKKFERFEASNTTDIDNYTLTTDDDGEIEINVSESDENKHFYVYEREAPKGYEKIDTDPLTLPYYPLGKLAQGTTIEQRKKTIYDPQSRGNLKLTKVEETNHNLKINGVQFQFYNQTSGKWVRRSKW